MGIQRGFTMVELMIAVVVMGIIMAVGMPKLGAIRDQASVRSATQQIGAYVATTRAAAIRRGLRANFKTRGDTMWVEIQQPGAPEIIAPPIPLAETFNIQLSTISDSITFDARGFALGLAATQKFVVTRASASDSICVTRLGMVSPQCAL
ncbi:MAG TPA: type II secretion system protein [Vicinamibacterales bacterium]|nr:type II secretion system protein [Vicinamibacterales bacterium]